MSAVPAEMQMIENKGLRRRSRDQTNGPMVLRNDGSRTLEIIGELPFDRVRLMPGDALKIETARASGPAKITLYDGGLQIDYDPEPPAQPNARDLHE